jgi:hypothetical protein
MLIPRANASQGGFLRRAWPRALIAFGATLSVCWTAFLTYMLVELALRI